MQQNNANHLPEKNSVEVLQNPPNESSFSLNGFEHAQR
jgi:hypothetical protein